MDSDLEPELKLMSLITQLISPEVDPTDLFQDQDSKSISLIGQIVSLLTSFDLNLQPKPESKFLSLTSQAISVFNSKDLDSQPKPLRNLMLLITQNTSLDKTKFMSLVDETLHFEPEPELISLIHQILSLVISMNSKWEKLISLCPQVEVRLKKGKFHVIKEVFESSDDKWRCLPLNWVKLRFTGEEDDTHFLCGGCFGLNHKEHNNALVEMKHNLHPKHSLRLVISSTVETRKCYCCDEDLREIFYYCSGCDYAVNVVCVEKPRVLSIDNQKWHEHTLALFPRKASLTCDLCALADSSCPFYVCPPCDFVVHQTCISLPRVIRISRHRHRISFTPSFDQGDWCCGVCRRKINNDYGGYSCINEGCSYAAHSKCATQRNVWDGKELEGESEEDIEEVEPFVKISDGIIQHFSHQHHHLRLDERTGRDYDENRQCQACIMPICFGNLYSCMQCSFILHEACAYLSRKLYHPIHPHPLALLGNFQGVLNERNLCSACPWLCTAGFFYECCKEECLFKLHVQCATVSEPLVHVSHMHPLFLTSKPEDDARICSVCKLSRMLSTNETFNCIECDFALCFACATLPQKMRYKHDKHTLNLSYVKEAGTTTYWCEACEGKINPTTQFYICDEYCCVTLHIKCLLGRDFYMMPGSSWLCYDSEVHVLPNNHHMPRPFCYFCNKRCQYKIVLQWSGLIFCSNVCISKTYRRGLTKIG